VLWDDEIEDLSPALRLLTQRAADATYDAYAIYSKFTVGAALRLSSPPDQAADERIITATNVENSSYGLTSCAERNAVFRAVAVHGKDVKWDLIALVARSRRLHPASKPTVSPCGACRQVLWEFKESQRARVVFLEKGRFVTKTIGSLLPFPFEL